MDMQSLSAFLKVCNHGGIRKAAEEMFITPQGLSQQIQRLEKWTGVKLFLRKKEGLRLSPEGALFKEYAENILLDTVEMQRQILDISRNAGYHVTVACSDTAALCGMVEALQIHALRVRQMTLDIRTFSDDSIDQIRPGGGADIVVYAAKDGGEPQAESLGAIPLFGAVDEMRHKKKQTDYGVFDIGARDIIFNNSRSGIAAAVISACEENEVETGKVMTAGESVTAMKLIKEINGLYIAPGYVMSGLRAQGITVIPFDESLPGPVLMIKSEPQPSEAAAGVAEFIEKYYSDNIA